jgi:hypothetical protein
MFVDCHFKGENQFFKAISFVLEDIENVTLQAIFFEWMECVRKCIDINSDYID